MSSTKILNLDQNMLSVFFASDIAFLTTLIVIVIAVGLKQIEQNNGLIGKYLTIYGICSFIILKMDNYNFTSDIISKMSNIPFYGEIQITMSMLFVVYLLINTQNRLKVKFDFYSLILIAFWSMIIFIESSELHVIYLCLEVQAFIFYTLIAGWQIKQTEQTALEGSLKYFIFGNLAGSAIILGATYIYGQYGIFDLELLRSLIISHQNTDLVWSSNSGFYLIFIGLMMKLGFFPFHFWLIDAYNAASLYVLLFLSVFPKVFLYYFMFSIQAFVPLFNYWL